MVDLTKYHHNRWDRVVEGLREDPRFAAVGPTDDDRREVFKAFVDEEEVRDDMSQVPRLKLYSVFQRL